MTIAHTGPVEVDIEPLLEQWGRWHRSANRLPTGGFRSTLAPLGDEGEEVVRRSRQTAEALRLLRRIRGELKERLADARATGDTDEVQRLRSVLSAEPRNAAALPWASLISGSGYRSTPDSPDEERMDRLIGQLPDKLAVTIRLEYCWWATQQMKAERLRINVRTYYYRLKRAKDELQRRWTATP